MGTVIAGKSITTNNCAYINADLCNGYKGGIYSRTKDGSLQGPNRKISTIENTNNWNSSMWYSTH